MENICDLCKNKLVEKGTREMGESLYRVLVCEKCNKQIIRRSEE